MPGHLEDLTGRRFGRLTVVALAPTRKHSGRAEWICRCGCGVVKQVVGGDLKQRNVRSCGCLRIEHMAGVGSRDRDRPANMPPALARQRRAILGIEEQRGADPPVTRHANAPVKRWDGAEDATRTLSALLLNSI